ncbi:MAG TPA: carboxypeptidase regulatory-like domain-containing protein, partial [bacterium]|nr:carboxypeptidase regulatory-like domain-containing protein [bacterium]
MRILFHTARCLLAGVFCLIVIVQVSAETLYFTDFSTDPALDGWSGFEPDKWEWGPAEASVNCIGGQDPDEDHSPGTDDRIIGFRIGRCNGNQPPETYLYTPVFNCSTYDYVYLDFYRVLGIFDAGTDDAAIEISTDGVTWTTLWEHAGDAFYDSDWTLQQYDLTGIAALSTDVRLRFKIASIFSFIGACGWNIDDLEIRAYQEGTVTGTVSDDTDAPIAGAVVTVAETGFETMSGPDGVYILDHPDGTWTVTCCATGHTTATAENVEINPGDTTVQNFELTYPVMSITPDAFDVSLNIGGMLSETLRITNSGNGPLTFELSGVPPWTDAPWDTVFEYDCRDLFWGCVWDLAVDSESFWLTALPQVIFSDPRLYELELDGSAVKNVYMLPSHSYDERYGITHAGDVLYLSCEDTLYSMDPATGEIMSEIAHGLGIDLEYLTFNPVAGTLYGCRHDSSIFEFTVEDTSVTPIRDFDPGIESVQGLAWDAASTGGPYLWISQSDYLVQIDPVREEFTGVDHMITYTGRYPGPLCCTTVWNPSRSIACFSDYFDDIPVIHGIELDAWTPWLSFYPLTGIVPPGETRDILVNFDASVPDIGDFTVNAGIQHSSGNEIPVWVPIAMHVSGDYRFAVDPDQLTGLGEAGFDIDYTLTMTNTGIEDDSYRVGADGGTWMVSLPGGTHFSVSAGETTAIPVRVTVPGDASPDDFDVSAITVTSQQIPTYSVAVNLHARCCGPTGAISGKVTAAPGSAPVAGALIRVVDTDLKAISDSAGDYTIDLVPVGSHTVFCSASGFIARHLIDIPVTHLETTEVHSVLDSAEINMEPETVEADIPDGDICVMPFTLFNQGTGNLVYDIEISPSDYREFKQWTPVTPTGPAGVTRPAGCFGDGRLFIAGGYKDPSAETAYSGIQIFDTASHSWFESAAMPVPVFSASAAYYHDKVYVMGGFAPHHLGRNTVQIYDTLTDTWSLGATMPTPRGGHSGGIIDGVIYVLGGTSGSGIFGDGQSIAYAYDIASDTWS